LISVTNNFSNGEFTVEINAQRVVPSQDPIAKPDSRGWVAPLTNDPNAADAPDFSGDSPREVWHDGMEGSRMPQGWYTHYQIQYWDANKDDNGIGVLPPTTENPDG